MAIEQCATEKLRAPSATAEKLARRRLQARLPPPARGHRQQQQHHSRTMMGLLRAVQGEKGDVGVTIFRVDSKYAIHIATGRTRPRSGPKAANRELGIHKRERENS